MQGRTTDNRSDLGGLHGPLRLDDLSQHRRIVGPATLGSACVDSPGLGLGLGLILAGLPPDNRTPSTLDDVSDRHTAEQTREFSLAEFGELGEGQLWILNHEVDEHITLDGLHSGIEVTFETRHQKTLAQAIDITNTYDSIFGVKELSIGTLVRSTYFRMMYWAQADKLAGRSSPGRPKPPLGGNRGAQNGG